MQKIKRWTFFGGGVWDRIYSEVVTEYFVIGKWKTKGHAYLRLCTTSTVYMSVVHWQCLHLIIFGDCCWPSAFDILLLAVTESMWKILKLGHKTPGFLSARKRLRTWYSVAVWKPLWLICIMSRFTTFFGQGIPRHQRNNNNHLTAVCSGQPG